MSDAFEDLRNMAQGLYGQANIHRSMEREGEPPIVPRPGLLAADHYYLAQLAESWFRLEESTYVYVTDTGAEIRIPVVHRDVFVEWIRKNAPERRAQLDRIEYKLDFVLREHGWSREAVAAIKLTREEPNAGTPQDSNP